MSTAIQSAVAALQAEYQTACAARDAINATNAPIQAQLDQANAEAESARVRAAELAAQIEANWGPGWVDLKSRIGRLANSIMELKRA